MPLPASVSVDIHNLYTVGVTNYELTCVTDQGVSTIVGATGIGIIVGGPVASTLHRASRRHMAPRAFIEVIPPGRNLRPKQRLRSRKAAAGIDMDACRTR